MVCAGIAQCHPLELLSLAFPSRLLPPLPLPPSPLRRWIRETVSWNDSACLCERSAQLVARRKAINSR